MIRVSLYLLFVLVLFGVIQPMNDKKRKSNDDKEQPDKNKKQKDDNHENNTNQPAIIHQAIDMSELVLSVKKNDLEKVKELLEKGANSNFRNNSFSDSIICNAVESIDAMRLLLEYGACPDTSDLCTLIRRSQSSENEILIRIELLIQYGADPNLQEGVFGTTVLHEAIEKEYLDIFEFFIKKYGVNPGLKDNLGRTVFHKIAQCGGLKGISFNQQAIRKCLEYGVDPLEKNAHGNTLLHVAIKSGNYSAGRLLLFVKCFLDLFVFSLKSDIESYLKLKLHPNFNWIGFETLERLFKLQVHHFVLIKNNDNKTVVDFARDKENYQLVQLLESYLLKSNQEEDQPSQGVVPPLKTICLKSILKSNKK